MASSKITLLVPALLLLAAIASAAPAEKNPQLLEAPAKAQQKDLSESEGDLQPAASHYGGYGWGGHYGYGGYGGYPHWGGSYGWGYPGYHSYGYGGGWPYGGYGYGHGLWY